MIPNYSLTTFHLFIHSGTVSYKTWSPNSLILSSSVSLLYVLQLFRFTIIKINLNDHMFIFKISDYLIFVKICSFHERNYLIFSLKIIIMSLKSLFALLGSFVYSHTPFNWWGYILRNAPWGKFTTVWTSESALTET